MNEFPEPSAKYFLVTLEQNSEGTEGDQPLRLRRALGIVAADLNEAVRITEGLRPTQWRILAAVEEGSVHNRTIQ